MAVLTHQQTERRVEMATDEHLVKCDPDYLNVEGLRMRALVCVREFK
jgi:hypothetical protein